MKPFMMPISMLFVLAITTVLSTALPNVHSSHLFFIPYKLRRIIRKAETTPNVLDVPLDVLGEVLAELPLSAVMKLSQTSKRFREYLSMPSYHPPWVKQNWELYLQELDRNFELGHELISHYYNQSNANKGRKQLNHLKMHMCMNHQMSNFRLDSRDLRMLPTAAPNHGPVSHLHHRYTTSRFAYVALLQVVFHGDIKQLTPVDIVKFGVHNNRNITLKLRNNHLDFEDISHDVDDTTTYPSRLRRSSSFHHGSPPASVIAEGPIKSLQILFSYKVIRRPLSAQTQWMALEVSKDASSHDSTNQRSEQQVVKASAEISVPGYEQLVSFDGMHGEGQLKFLEFSSSNPNVDVIVVKAAKGVLTGSVGNGHTPFKELEPFREKVEGILRRCLETCVGS